jgi:uncharacterized Zn-finger protein
MASFVCTECEKSYKNRSTLATHQRMHDGTAFACDFCEKRFDLKTALKRHRIAHTFAKPYACDVDGCEKKFATDSYVLLHKRTVHEKVPRKYRCEQCDRACGTLSKLNSHRRAHTGERPYACTECASKFSNKSNLQTHYRWKHTLERPHACAHCSKAFVTTSERNGHQRRMHK